MILFYAFTDASGTWHGDPDADIHEPQPRHGNLTLPAPPQAGPATSLFAGQTLRVLYAATDLEPSATTYQLDNGDWVLASWHVHELLSAPYQTAAHAPPSDPPPPATVPVAKLEIYAANRRYSFDAEQLDGGRVEVNIMITSTAGEIYGALTGETDATDLAHLSRLLKAAADACPASPPAPSAPAPSAKPAQRGAPWTEDLLDLLRAAHADGKDEATLAEEFGRSEAAIRWKLWDLRLEPFPKDLVPDRRANTIPEQPKAYTVTDKRQAHPNAYKKWEPEDDRLLARRAAEGAAIAELSQEFGRDEGAVISRLNKIGAIGPAADEAARYTY
ncbi:hypothetical protein [Streptomyces apocyni]|uniref:hypothetical protein n=1 Tax=Streptomyces apocyni TaxID=2654677 RepID=UPI0012E9B241|nr:hypothetical protein [Streptomyces apocyni]